MKRKMLPILHKIQLLKENFKTKITYAFIIKKKKKSILFYIKLNHKQYSKNNPELCLKLHTKIMNTLICKFISQIMNCTSNVYM